MIHKFHDLHLYFFSQAHNHQSSFVRYVHKLLHNNLNFDLQLCIDLR